MRRTAVVDVDWGIHACRGSHLACAELTTFFSEVVRHGLRFQPVSPPDRDDLLVGHERGELHVRMSTG